MIKKLFKTIKDYLTELFVLYKDDTINKNTSSKIITKGGFYTTIHENIKNSED